MYYRRLSCKAPGLDKTTYLGQGVFVEPVVQALKAIGQMMIDDDTFHVSIRLLII